MGDSHSGKPGSRSGSGPSPQPAADSTRSPAPANSAPPTPDARGNTAGRIVHDERGNAIWDWLKDTARTAIDSTSRLLRKLEVPELKVEDTRSQELRLESDRDPGGGYDPYGGSGGPTSGRTSGAGTCRNAGGGYDPYGRSSPASSATHKPVGGGYDPYGKSITPKPHRKP